MDAHEKSNWRKVKTALEEAGKTDSFIYKRALAICCGLKDPGPFPTDWNVPGDSDSTPY